MITPTAPGVIYIKAIPLYQDGEIPNN